MNPYVDIDSKDDVTIRVFSKDVDDHELMWHRDKEDRLVESLEKTDWMVQLDNELPKPLNQEVFIPKGIWHRAIKGSNDLTLKIKKL